MKRERCQPTRSEEHVLSFPEPLPVGELLAKSKPAVFGKAEDIELLVVQEFRGANLPSIHLDSVQVVGLRGCCFGRVTGVYVTSTHGPLRTNPSGVKEGGYRPDGPFFQRWGSHIVETVLPTTRGAVSA
jgi:hypothetical protein